MVSPYMSGGCKKFQKENVQVIHRHTVILHVYTACIEVQLMAQSSEGHMLHNAAHTAIMQSNVQILFA